MSNGKLKQFHSCFIVDVEIDESSNEVRLLDSNRMKYVYRLDSGIKAEGFKSWLTSVFLAGKAQTLSGGARHTAGNNTGCCRPDSVCQP